MGLPRFCSPSDLFAEFQVECFYSTMLKGYSSLVRSSIDERMIEELVFLLIALLNKINLIAIMCNQHQQGAWSTIKNKLTACGVTWYLYKPLLIVF